MPHCLRAQLRCAWLLLVALAALSPIAALAQEAGNDGLGKQVFTTESQPPCALCHTLADAGSTAEIGPNLDDLNPTQEQVAAAVRDGVGIMPAYAETLTEEQISAVSEYVAKAVGTDSP